MEFLKSFRGTSTDLCFTKGCIIFKTTKANLFYNSPTVRQGGELLKYFVPTCNKDVKTWWKKIATKERQFI